MDVQVCELYRGRMNKQVVVKVFGIMTVRVLIYFVLRYSVIWICLFSKLDNNNVLKFSSKVIILSTTEIFSYLLKRIDINGHCLQNGIGERYNSIYRIVCEKTQ